MGMLDMVRHWLSSGGKDAEAAKQTSADSTMAYSADEIAGLDFKKAIDAHMQWKERLRAVIDGRSDERLAASELASDDLCALGRWIHAGGGDRYRHMDQFRHLQEHHAEFHVCAASVLTEAQAGRIEDAQRLMAAAYARASEQVKHDLIRLYLQLTAEARRG